MRNVFVISNAAADKARSGFILISGKRGITCERKTHR
jgi:hypothetical protein